MCVYVRQLLLHASTKSAPTESLHSSTKSARTESKSALVCAHARRGGEGDCVYELKRAKREKERVLCKERERKSDSTRERVIAQEKDSTRGQRTKRDCFWERESI